MPSLKATILTALWTTGVIADDITHWFTTTCTETAWATPEKEVVTYWATQWSTAPPETVWNTVWSTYVKPTTYISVETSTVTTTEFVYSTENNYFTNTATEIQVSRETATATATATVTSASVIVSVSTALVTVTETTCPPTTTTLVGLVTCTTRDINPTYTPTAALPTDFLWGCPPGTLCTPKQIGCNFEQNIPGPEYVCSPEECKVPEPLPPLDDALIDYNCTPLVPIPGYIYLDPIQFHLDFSIYEFNGQPGHSCPPPPPPPPSTTWPAPPPPPPPSTTWPAPPPPAPPSTTVWSGWTTTPAPPPPPPSTTIPKASPESESKSYGGGISYGQSWSTWNPSAPSITARANLAERADLVERQQVDLSAPAICIGPCNNAALVAESYQLVSSLLCPTTGAWSTKYSDCANCILTKKPSQVNHPPEALFTNMAVFVDFCQSQSPLAVESSTPPPLPPTTTTTRSPPPPPTTTTTRSPTTTSSPPPPPTTTTTTTPSPTTTTKTPSTTTPAIVTISSSAVVSPVSTSTSTLPSTYTGAAAPLGGSPVLNLAMALPLLINLGLA